MGRDATGAQRSLEAPRGSEGSRGWRGARGGRGLLKMLSQTRLGALLQVPEGTHPREFLKKLEQPEDPEEHGYNKKARRARDLPSILGRTSAAPRPHVGRTSAAPRLHTTITRPGTCLQVMRYSSTYRHTGLIGH